MDGVLNFLKPPGMTSHDAVAFVRRIACQKRVGHTGTLDPAAAGVLPICLGQATRLVEYLQAGRKTYIAELSFGIETDSHDAMGNVVSESDASHVNLASLRAVLDGFRGKIMQSPPIFSAIKKDGKKLCELARGGTGESEIEILPREIEIYNLVVTRAFVASTRPRVMLQIECGSGTYVRSLARDIGRALGCGATMTFLVRTQNGAFSIDEAKTPAQIDADLESALIPFPDALRMCARASIEDDEAVEKFAKGQSAEAISCDRAPLDEYQCDSDKSENSKTQAWGNGAHMEFRRVAFLHSDGKTAVLANSSPDAPTIYRAEKVFFLDRNDS
jgi:tRNA pseudouridine55 synthase